MAEYYTELNFKLRIPNLAVWRAGGRPLPPWHAFSPPNAATLDERHEASRRTTTASSAHFLTCRALPLWIEDAQQERAANPCLLEQLYLLTNVAALGRRRAARKGGRPVPPRAPFLADGCRRPEWKTCDEKECLTRSSSIALPN